MEFIAKTKEPLIVVNHLLGYKIRLILEEFMVYSLDAPNGNRTRLNSLSGGEVMELTGYYYYETIIFSGFKGMQSLCRGPGTESPYICF
jgi:hypothetical protein